MKKLLILTAISTILTVPAVAVQKCVALDINQDWSRTDVNGSADWSATANNGIKVQALAVCANNSGSMYDVSAALEFSADEPGQYCWCRMISPVVSKWVAYGDLDSWDYCNYDCLALCSSAFESDKDFVATLFNNLSD